jgi:hypothetical protein
MKEITQAILGIFLALSFLIWTASCISYRNEYLPKLAEEQSWHLIFEDDFDGDKVDHSKWTRHIHWRKLRRDDFKVLWAPESFSVGEGKLKIKTSYQGIDSESGQHLFYSGGLGTIGKFESGFGYYESRVKILSGAPGVNAAVWLMSPLVYKEGNDGRDGTEIDVIEMPWHDGHIQHALHWDGYKEAHQHINQVFAPSEGLQPDKWVTASVWWTPEEYIFYLNGKESWRTKAGGVSQAEDAHILLSSMITAPWGLKKGEEFDFTKLPVEFEVEYVRAYALSNENKFSTGIIPDPGFEKMLWTFRPRQNKDFGEFMYTSNPDEIMQGKQALKVEVFDHPKRHDFSVNASAPLNLQSHKSYQFSFYAKADSPKAILNLAVNYRGEATERKITMEGLRKELTLSQEWKYYTCEFTTGDIEKIVDQANVRFNFSTVGTFLVDQIDIVETERK